jgi:hypothetical protein
MEGFYTLPEISFVAGERQEIVMNLWTPKPNSYPFNANSCVVNFSVIDYSNKIGEALISKICPIRVNEDNIPCIAVAELMPIETVAMYGKYVYQVSIMDSNGDTEIPNQGIMYVAKNINQAFIQGNL